MVKSEKNCKLGQIAIAPEPAKVRDTVNSAIFKYL